MNLERINYLAQCYWEKQPYKQLDMPPKAKVVTGRINTDKFIHWMIEDNGVEMIYEPMPLQGVWRLKNYSVVDEKKFAWFVIKWS